MKWAEEKNKVYTEYTGGGIWIAYMYVSEHIYYCTGTADYEFGKFDDRKENVEEGMLMGIVWTHWYCDDADDNWDYPCKITLTEKEQKILSILLETLDKVE